MGCTVIVCDLAIIAKGHNRTLREILSKSSKVLARKSLNFLLHDLLYSLRVIPLLYKSVDSLSPCIWALTTSESRDEALGHDIEESP
jgi:hypothetical protein